jgi:FixJ family two-component response regulator
MKAGAAAFLTKPVRSEALLASIRAAIGRTESN